MVPGSRDQSREDLSGSVRALNIEVPELALKRLDGTSMEDERNRNKLEPKQTGGMMGEIRLTQLVPAGG
jgi:hypothetical protein